MAPKRKMASTDVNDRRAHVISLLMSGVILQNEAAELAGVTRQRIHQWVRKSGIHPTMARKRYLRALMQDDR